MARNRASTKLHPPHIGIWWDDGKTCIALSESAADGEFAGDWIDSRLMHWEKWPEVAGRFGKSDDDEYFDIPRGRVLLNKRNGHGRILHGAATDKARLAVVAEQFHLKAWKALVDDHYAMGDDASALFDEDW